jgi:hypothetical protein
VSDIQAQSQIAGGSGTAGSTPDTYQANRIAIPRACDLFDFFVFPHIQPVVFKPPGRTVILSEALCRSISNRELYGAESKDPGDACLQMLLGAFRPQTTTQDKKVTNSDRSGVERPAIFSPYFDSFFGNVFSATLH